MGKFDSKKVLWANVSRLMQKHYGKDNLTKLATDAKFGPGTSTRLKEQKTSVGTDLLDQLADAFGVQTWQLLVPDLDPENLPSLGGEASEWPMKMVSRKRFMDLPSDARLFVQGYLRRLIEEQESAQTNSNNGGGAGAGKLSLSQPGDGQIKAA